LLDLRLVVKIVDLVELSLLHDYDAIVFDLLHFHLLRDESTQIALLQLDLRHLAALVLTSDGRFNFSASSV